MSTEAQAPTFEALLAAMPTLSQRVNEIIAERDQARRERDVTQREYASLHAIWEQAAEIVADEGDVFETDQDVLDAIQAKDDIAANDTGALEAGRSWQRIRSERDQAQAALDEAVAERNDLRAQVTAMREVFEAAQAWAVWFAELRPTGGMFIPENELAIAMSKALEAGVR